MFVRSINTIVAGALPAAVQEQAQIGLTLPVPPAVAGGLMIVGMLVGTVILLGLAFVSVGAAERVPAEEIRTARALRLFAWTAAMVFIAWNVVPPLLAVGVEVQLIVLALLPIAVGYVQLLYKVLTN